MTGVVGLVYIAALAPDAGETSQSQQEKFPVTDVFKYGRIGRGAPLDAAGRRHVLRGDLPEQEQKLVWATHYARLRSLQPECARHRLEVEAELYIVANNDRTVQPELERFLAKTDGLQAPTLSTAATSRCCPIQTSSSTSSVKLQRPFAGRPLKA